MRHGRVAQWRERLPYKQKVGGSIPPAPTQLPIRLTKGGRIVGSIPDLRFEAYLEVFRSSLRPFSRGQQCVARRRSPATPIVRHAEEPAPPRGPARVTDDLIVILRAKRPIDWAFEHLPPYSASRRASSSARSHRSSNSNCSSHPVTYSVSSVSPRALMIAATAS